MADLQRSAVVVLYVIGKCTFIPVSNSYLSCVQILTSTLRLIVSLAMLHGVPHSVHRRTLTAVVCASEIQARLRVLFLRFFYKIGTFAAGVVVPFP